jgi:hypothetical protein
LEIPQPQRDFHVFHRPGYGGWFLISPQQQEQQRQDKKNS